MSSLEQILKAYEQAGSILPSQYQCRPPVRAEAIPLAICGPCGGAGRSRTDDILLAKQALYQLSYGPIGVSGIGAGRSRQSDPVAAIRLLPGKEQKVNRF